MSAADKRVYKTYTMNADSNTFDPVDGMMNELVEPTAAYARK